MSGAAAPGSVDGEHPWLGLDSFTEETRQFFHGREEEVAELARRVQRAPLTILFGQSGLGKTSILRAGLVPRLRGQGYCPVYVRIDYSADSPAPAEQIKEAIFRATRATGEWTRPGAAVEGESLWEFLHHRDDLLQDASGRTITPLLIFDQFEEIFTLAQADDAGRARARQFIEDLADLAENRPPAALEARLEEDETLTDRFDFARSDYRILIALREDYLANLEGLKRQMPSITQNRIRLARMNGTQALDAVLKPGGRLVSQEVAESIVRFVAGGSELRNAEVEPSLLSLICRELNNARVAQGRSEISADLLAGSHETILAEFYERALEDQPAAVRQVIEDELLTDSGYRENLAEERVLKAFAAAGAAPDALATLVNRRLLRIEERLDVRRVELTHDVLCGVVQASRQVRREREAREEVERKLAAQREREEATRTALHRARRVALACAILAAGAVLGAGFGYYNLQRARGAEADALKARQLADASRGEAEKLVAFLLDDFYDELAPVGRLDAVRNLANSAVSYYRELPPELRTPSTQLHEVQALVRLAAVHLAQGSADEAGRVTDRAEQIAEGLRSAGNGSVDAAFTSALARSARAGWLARRAELPAALDAFRQADAFLSPALQGDPSGRTKQLHLDLVAGAAIIQARLGQPAAKESLLNALELARKLQAQELTDLRVTETYLTALQRLAVVQYFNDGDGDAATKSATDVATLAGKLLERRPDHRPALRMQAVATAFIGRIEYDSLQLQSALARVLEQHALLERIVAADPSNTASWIELGNCKTQVANMLRDLGRMDEGVKWLEASAALPGKFKADANAARAFLFPAGFLAEWHAAMGRTDQAQAAIAQLRKLAAAAKSGAASDYFVDLASTYWSARTKLWGGAAAEARADVDAVLARAQEPAMRPLLQPGWDIPSHVLRYRASMVLKDYAGAESAMRAALAAHEQSRAGRLNMIDVANRAQAKTELALALLRQGKNEEARQLLKPVVPFYRQANVVGAADNEQQVRRAEFLMAYGLAFPAERRERLAEASAVFKARPETIRRWKEFALVGDEISQEVAKP